MKKKVLILGVAAVQLDAIKQLKEMGYEVHACAMANDGPGAKEADYFQEINILDKESLINYIQENSISVVYSVGSDLSIPVASALSEKLNLPKFVSEKTAMICNNKDLMRETLGNDFEGNVNFQIIKNQTDKIELPFPFILKPTDSQGQRGVVLIHNEAEFNEQYPNTKHYSRSGLVIIEKYVTGPEISVNGYLIDGKIKFLVASDRETWPNYTGLIHKHVVPSKVITQDNQDKLKKIIESACVKLNITNGPVYVQMKVENNMPYIIEITSRLDGCHMWNILEKYTGINLLQLTFDHLLNNDTAIMDQFTQDSVGEYVLEFICQEPNTKADYGKFNKPNEEILEYFQYYEQDAQIRAVNGKYEKIGYFIYKTK